MKSSRNSQIERLKNDNFDILVIGGGATGAGVFLDAAMRGLKVALIEKGDFAGETSSRSTKLIHGGVRYLEKAFKGFDRSQFKLVYEGLHERRIMLAQAPHLAKTVAILLPVYSGFEKFYYSAGLKVYDWMAAKTRLKPTYTMNAGKTLDKFPLLREKNLKGGIVYHDGSFNDARMALSVVLTGIEYGGAAANYVEMENLTKREDRVTGAAVRDLATGEGLEIRAKAVVSATGPFTDRILKMDDPASESIIEPSLGTHLVLEDTYTPSNMGLLIPRTSDGRLLFVLPWQKKVILGTTDRPSEAGSRPEVPREDVDYLLSYMERYYKKSPRKNEIKSKWAGIRPLARESGAGSTSKVSREHVVKVTPSGLVVTAGGKWTSYRKMAEDVVDRVVGSFRVAPKSGCLTKTVRLVGSRAFRPTIKDDLKKEFGIDADVAESLMHTYGDEAFEIAKIAKDGHMERIHPDHPFVEAEVIWAARNEMAMKVSDILARRTRLAFIDMKAAFESARRVAEILGKELNWEGSKTEDEFDEFIRDLERAV